MWTAPLPRMSHSFRGQRGHAAYHQDWSKSQYGSAVLAISIGKLSLWRRIYVLSSSPSPIRGWKLLQLLRPHAPRNKGLFHHHMFGQALYRVRWHPYGRRSTSKSRRMCGVLLVCGDTQPVQILRGIPSAQICPEGSESIGYSGNVWRYLTLKSRLQRVESIPRVQSPLGRNFIFTSWRPMTRISRVIVRCSRVCCQGRGSERRVDGDQKFCYLSGSRQQ